MFELIVSEIHCIRQHVLAVIGHCTVHDLLQCMFFMALGTLVTSGGELHSDDELRDWEIGCVMMHCYLC